MAHMGFEVSTTRQFSAAHQLRLSGGVLEPLHGHNWRVKVTVGADRLDSMGVVIDFHELERQVDAIITPLHNRHLNDLAPFGELNPSAENVAYHIGRSLNLPKGIILKSVEVWETDSNSALWRP
jgi:6-pyruvoyltetrahydropterin/6-carboxytetrahydropterin synthase